MFDSTGQYAEELKPAIGYCEYLAEQCKAVFDTPYEVKKMIKEVQRDNNTCGVFSLFYIYARILGIDPDTVFERLQHNKQNSHIRMFKEIMFGA